MTEKEIRELIAARLGIKTLNKMQMLMATAVGRSILLLSPTGSGKTVAFAMALLKRLGPPSGNLQAVVIAPTRELAMQIGEVISKVAVGYRVLTFYGGHSMRDEAASLSVTPDVIVATPGRLLDHRNRHQIDLRSVRTAVLDEYDKSLELGFADEMRQIVRAMGRLKTLILTSATRLKEYPEYLNPSEVTCLDFTKKDVDEDKDEDSRPSVEKLRMVSWQKDKLQALEELVNSLENDGGTMVFVNHRESAERVYKHLRSLGFPAGLYHGGLEQRDREDALEMFNNGSTAILVTTDLGARGLDIIEAKNVIHYHIPVGEEMWTHRNGRVGRLGGHEGRVFIITAESEEDIPQWIEWDRDYHPHPALEPIQSKISTLYFNIGRREKISRGDIVGFLTHKGGLDGTDIGRIALRDHCALVAVNSAKANEALSRLAGEKIKNKRVKLSLKK